MSTSILDLPSRIDRSSWVSWACYYAGFMFTAQRAGADAMLEDRTGLVVLAASVVAFFACVIVLQRYMSIALTSNTFGEPQQLVTSGVFRYTRNPIYLAFLIPLGALAWFSPLAALLTTVVYLVAMTLWVIAREEEVLSARFPREFEAYRERTPRWFAI